VPRGRGRVAGACSAWYWAWGRASTPSLEASRVLGVREGPPRPGPLCSEDVGPASRGLVEEGPLRRVLVEEGPLRRGLVEEGPLRRVLVEEGPLRRGLVEEGPLRRGLVEEGPLRRDVCDLLAVALEQWARPPSLLAWEKGE